MISLKTSIVLCSRCSAPLITVGDPDDDPPEWLTKLVQTIPAEDQKYVRSSCLVCLLRSALEKAQAATPLSDEERTKIRHYVDLCTDAVGISTPSASIIFNLDALRLYLAEVKEKNDRIQKALKVLAEEVDEDDVPPF